ncbi:hypothetical protein U9M48_001276, partial [Paspalum notatum var. saurae]
VPRQLTARRLDRLPSLTAAAPPRPAPSSLHWQFGTPHAHHGKRVASDESCDGGSDDDRGVSDDECLVSAGSDDDDYAFEDICEEDAETAAEAAVDDDDDDREKQEPRYIVLTEDAVRARQESETAKRRAPQDAWFSDEPRVRAAVGLPLDAAVPAPATATSTAAGLVCAICFAWHAAGETRSAACGAHFYCAECWRAYICAAVEDGARCLSLRCPDPSCSAAVVAELMDAAAGARGRGKVRAVRAAVVRGGQRRADQVVPGRRLLPRRGVRRRRRRRRREDGRVLRRVPARLLLGCGEEARRPVSCGTVRAWLAKNASFSETSNWVLANTKHCPRCRMPIERAQGCMHMTCPPPCEHGFCWEAHRPVPCGTVRAWLSKNSSDAETANWVLVNTKHCPECRRPIEKNQGCNHMTCRAPCRHQFCWLCLDPWNDHRGCSRFDSRQRPQQQQARSGKAVGGQEEEEARRRQAKASLDRYLYHYERWAANGKSLHKALADMDQLERSELERMARAVDLPATDLGFVTEAYRQVADGRRVLRWVHAYGYFLDPERDATKRVLFEDLQSQANRWLECLHACAELERKDLFSAASNGESAVAAEMFRAYREKVANLTGVTRKFLRNLVEAFETDLPEVATPPSVVQTVNGPTMGPQTVRLGGIISTTAVSNVASQGLSTRQASSSSSLISQEANIAIDGVQEHIPIMNPVRPGGHSSLLSYLSQVQLMNSAFFGGSTSMELPDAGAAPIQVHMSNMISTGVTSTPSTSGPVQPIGNQPIVQSTALGFSGSNTRTELGNSDLDGSSSHLNIMVLGQSAKPVPQGPMTGLQLGQSAIGANQNVISGLRPTTLSSAPAKYAKIWEGYSNATTPETLVVDWPEGMHIARLISQEHMNNKQYAGRADFLVFRTLNQHGFLQQLQEKKLCAVITLPSQTLLLSMSEKESRMIGMLFPLDMVVFKPQMSTQPQPMEQQQELQQHHMHMQPLGLPLQEQPWTQPQMQPMQKQQNYVKLWEGYRSRTASEIKYVGTADFLVFRTLTEHGFLQQLQEKKLCAVIVLPTQTLLLSMSDKANRMIGMLFPGDMVVFKPQVSSVQEPTMQLQQQQPLQQQLHQQQQLLQQQYMQMQPQVLPQQQPPPQMLLQQRQQMLLKQLHQQRTQKE